MSRGLPKPAVSVRAGRLPEDFGEHGRLVSEGVVGQHPAGVTPEVVEALGKADRIVLMIKDHRVQVCRHDDVGVDAQPFLTMAEGETVRQKTTRPFTYKHGQPGHDAVGDEVDGRVIVYAVCLHGNRVVKRGGGCKAKGRGDLRSEEWRGLETTPQQGIRQGQRAKVERTSPSAFILSQYRHHRVARRALARLVHRDDLILPLLAALLLRERGLAFHGQPDV